MKIAINTRLVIRNRMDGIGWFTLETMPRIARDHPEHRFYFIFDRPVDPSFIFPPNVACLHAGPVTRHPSLIRFWNRFSVPMLLRRIKPDLYLSPDGFLPLGLRIPSIVTIHDLNFEHHPGFLPRRYRQLYQKWVRAAAVSSTRILTVSKFSKGDIEARYGIDPAKTDVVFCGLNSYLKPIDEDSILRVKEKFGIRKPYFIITGSLHPRKNPCRIIAAYHLFRQKTGMPVGLVFAGNRKWMSRGMKTAIEGTPYREDIIFTGRVSGEDLNGLTRGADAMLFVSVFEGFGLPILEAAEAGIPVITSDNTSMKEIAGDSALLVDPFNIQEIADGMARISSDPILREQLVQKGKALIGKYSWDITAKLTWDSILKTLPHDRQGDGHS